MTSRPIIAGVDGSPESVRAAVMGSVIAEAAGSACHLVHATPDYALGTSLPEFGDVTAMRLATAAHARELIRATLEANVPTALLATLDVRMGRAPLVLAGVAAELDAELIVLGGKRHRGLARLFGGTIPHMVRTCDVPVLATDGSPGGISRVLAAVDLSHAARHTIAAAERFAALFGAKLRVLHVAEPLPVIPGFTARVDDDEEFRAAERVLETSIWPVITYRGAETVVRRGRSAAAIIAEVTEWRADLVVVGSHGKGWVDRLLIGSTSERLLSFLPTQTLVVPVGRPAPVEHAGAAATMPWENRQ